MDEFLKKLSETGIKTLDLLNRGIDKLPDGFEAMFSALEFKYKVIGFVWLVFGFICLTLLVGFWVYVLKTKWLYVTKEVWSYQANKYYKSKEVPVERGIFAFFFSLVAGLATLATLCNFHVWYMALDPRGYILMRVAEYLLGIGKK